MSASDAAALDRVCVMVASWMQNRRQSASDTLGEIADLLETTGRTVDNGPAGAVPATRAHLRLVSNNHII